MPVVRTVYSLASWWDEVVFTVDPDSDTVISLSLEDTNFEIRSVWKYIVVVI